MKLGLIRQDCKLCGYWYCGKHIISEQHGCEDRAKQKARDDWFR